MVKQVIIAAMEEVLGEYVLNMSKENLKIAALRGKIKLENVQLDGDLIGSVVMGMFGLTQFGILSCVAQTIDIHVPWKNLEAEPTRFQIHNVHLVCVPLIPSTATKLYGAGTRVDPRCSLRTRAKRLALARLERNFWNGQIIGEGPPMKRIQRAVRDLERDYEKKRKQRKNVASTEETELEDTFDHLMHNLQDGSTTRGNAVSGISVDDLPELPRDWKVKLREKIMRNMEASIQGIHIRVEVSDGGLAGTADVSKPSPIPGSGWERSSDDKAFAIGFQLESFVMRTANAQWEVGSHDKRSADGSAMSNAKGHLGPNAYAVKNNKIGYFNGFSIYWDDEPPLVLADTDVLQGNYRRLSPEKLQSRISAAMKALFHKQEPGKSVRHSLAQPLPDNMDDDKPHEYICRSLNMEVRSRQSDRTCPGPISCSADVLPFEFTFNIRPHQWFQYQRLKGAIKAQQRFDTMLRQRPNLRPAEDPRSWWKYAMACVTGRPDSRPWADVKVIVQSRPRYIELVAKKNGKSSEGNGFHAGLSDKESAELLVLEDLLPMEALEAFHLLALRGAYESQGRVLDTTTDVTSASGNEEVSTPQRSRMRGRGSNPFRLLSGSRKRRSSSAYSELANDDLESRQLSVESELLVAASFEGQDPGYPPAERDNSLTLLEAMTLRLGKKVWFVYWKFHDATVNLVFMGPTGSRPLAHAVLRANGHIRSFGKGKRDFFFDIVQCDAFHRQDRVMYLRSPADNVDGESSADERSQGTDDGTVDSTLSGGQSVNLVGPDLSTASRFLSLPSRGTVCQMAAVKNMGTFKLSISVHPATLVWTTSLFDSISEFFNVEISEAKDLAQHIRNAATPLARKAQLALLSPSFVSLHLNIVAPRIWIPISKKSEGSVCVEAGTLKLAGLKEEGATDMNWDIQTRDIRMNFVKGRDLASFDDGLQLQILAQLTEPYGRAEHSIIRPFHVSFEARNRPPTHYDFIANRLQQDSLPVLVRAVDVVISPVSLNLVDAEVLARTIGKWYVRGIHGVRHRASSNTATVQDGLAVRGDGGTDEHVGVYINENIPRLLTLTLDKVEIALEGHSKVASNAADDRSLASQDSFHEIAPPTRTYVVDIVDISVQQTRQDDISMTKFSVGDAAIARLRDGSLYTPLKPPRELSESQYSILVRARGSQLARESEAEKKEELIPSRILTASHMHDRRAHSNEVEVDIDSVVLRVTPTTLKDCAKAFRRVVELAQLVTREMERKVHEEGRKARLRGRQDGDSLNHESLDASTERPGSPAQSEAMTELSSSNRRRPASDSSILFRLTLHESTLLAGRPTTAIERTSTPFHRDRTVSFAVVQVLSNALIMFQSIENPDASGSKTLHISVDNVSSLVNTDFERVIPEHVSPMIGPTGAEFRVVYTTENFGRVVSQDLSFDCEEIKACMTPNDVSIFLNICKKMFERLKAFSENDGTSGGRRPMTRRVRPLTSIMRYRQKGTGIATKIRAELQAFSFVLLRAYKSLLGAPEFLDFNVKDLKGKLQGCVSALTGEFTAYMSVNFFNAEVADWEYVVEPFPVTLSLDQMPNELVMGLTSENALNLNVTGILLRDLSDMNFDILRDRRPQNDGLNEGAVLSPTALSTVGLRRATQSRSITVQNRSGLDVHVVPDRTPFNHESGFIRNGSIGSFDVSSTGGSGSNDETVPFSLRLSESAIEKVGDREPVYDLPVASICGQTRLYLLRPVAAYESFKPGRQSLMRLLDGRASPETILSEATNSELAFHNAEPVVEWCMQNQRLRSSTVDVFSLDKGRDLLSSLIWSPEDELVDFADSLDSGLADDGPEAAAGTQRAHSPNRGSKQQSSSSGTVNNWLKPYLKNDSPEWTDMTCTLKMARERVMLPDNNWLWVNDWTVDLSGELDVSTDADGWEYEADFETFTRKRRGYQRGDSCRRRRWTRTRIVKPPRPDDPFRQIKLVWEATKDDNGNYHVFVRSHVRVKNSTSTPLSFFVFSPTWDEDVYIGSINAGEDLCVPANVAAAVYMRVAKKNGTNDPLSIRDCVSSERFPILPTSHTSTHHLRVTMELADVSCTTMHYLIGVESRHGVVDITIESALRIVNLLPCELECQFGELLGALDSRTLDNRPVLGGKGTKRISQCESLSIGSGREGSCTAISPWKRPHVSFRVPGYQWSPWQRVVNRKSNSGSWRPPAYEEDWHFSSKGDNDFADETKTIVVFKRVCDGGDPLRVILSVSSDHCPTLRVYSQFWIVDKTGFGCHFAEGFVDFLGSSPDPETSRRSHLPSSEAKDSEMKRDFSLPGHQWSMGKSGMSLFFSGREKLTLAIETGIEDRSGFKGWRKIRSKWVSPLDISIVVPKTAFSVDELNGPRRFELAISVTVCPGIFARTRVITILPRYQIVNLLHRELVVAQDGALDSATFIPSQSAVPFHWEKRSLAPKVRLGVPSVREKGSGVYDSCWTNGRLRVDRVGITAMRLPTDMRQSKIPLVVQAEVRLASKEQSSAVVIVIWAANQNSNPLYLLRNRTPFTILCRQPLSNDHGDGDNEDHGFFMLSNCSDPSVSATDIGCSGSEFGPLLKSFLGLDHTEEFVWVLKSNDVACFGFDDPEKPHSIEWTCAIQGLPRFDRTRNVALLEVDAMGSMSEVHLGGRRRVRCQISAEHSTKVIEFVEINGIPSSRQHDIAGQLSERESRHAGGNFGNGRDLSSVLDVIEIQDEEEDPAFSLRIEVPGLFLSIVDNVSTENFGREILLAMFDKIYFCFSQTREGYHEFELRLMTMQVDNHVHKSIHPVLIFCPRLDESEPLLHMSAVRRLQHHSNTYVFRYAAIRVLEVEIYLDRRTAETIARFIEPLKSVKDEGSDEAHPDWLAMLTSSMGRHFATPDRRAPREIEKMIHTANSGRIYFEQLHLHPVRLSLTFTQEWMEWNPGVESMMLFQFIRGMASIANAPLVFTSFVVGHVFEAPQALVRVIATHYSSQLTKQIFGILGSLAILGAPTDFITNVGTGVRDFFYEPIQGAVLGPRQFIEGLEAGTQSLARGVFVGIVRGAANVAEVVNANLAGLTADDDFIDERKAHQRMLTDAMSRGATSRSFGDSLTLASASIARGMKSGALGMVEQPTIYASKYGPVGFAKGVGKAAIGAVVKPIVGLGDAAVLVMNHLSDATSKKQVLPKIPKRLRRALPCRSTEKPNCVRLEPYDERASKAQKIVTGGESVDDVYLGHLNIPSHLIIASYQCLWAIDKRSRDPWCVSWEEISHFGLQEEGVPVVVFSQTGLRTFVFDVDSREEATKLYNLLSMQKLKMGNSSDLNSTILNTEPESLSRHQIPGIKAPQVNHVFGSWNQSRKKIGGNAKDEIELVEQCFSRVRVMGSDSSTFFKTLDQESWSLISSWGQVFSGLSSRRCIAASVINGTGSAIQIKSTKLVEGGSPCYSIPTREFDQEQGILHPGGVIIFFGWGVVPNLLQPGRVFMHVETSAFICDLTDRKSRETYAEAMPGYQIGFLEKSYDESGWWAKYWLLVRAKK